jgi:hypothetical protein
MMMSLCHSNFALNLTHMTTEKVQTQGDQPESAHWKLYANFLIRELVRMWYGQKSIFDASKIHKQKSSFWERLGHTFSWTVISFGDYYGLSRSEMAERIEEMEEELRSGAFPTFSEPAEEVFYFAKRTLGDELAKRFLCEYGVLLIFGLIVGAYRLAAEGKMPPYKRQGLIPSLEFCETLRVAPDMEKLYYGENTSP